MIPEDLGQGEVCQDRSHLLLLFKQGDRPGRDDLNSAVRKIEGLSSVTPNTGSEGGRDDDVDWVELQQSCLTFDCSGLAPGRAEPLPDIGQWVGFDASASQTAMDGMALTLGPHLQAGRATIPVLKGLLTLAGSLVAELPSCLGCVWTASGVAMDRVSFQGQIARFAETGALPMAFLVSFAQQPDDKLMSSGLGYFSVPELQLAGRVTPDASQAALLGQRIAEQIILRGAIADAEDLVGPDGRTLTLSPDNERGLIIVRPA